MMVTSIALSCANPSYNDDDDDDFQLGTSDAYVAVFNKIKDELLASSNPVIAQAEAYCIAIGHEKIPPVEVDPVPEFITLIQGTPRVVPMSECYQDESGQYFVSETNKLAVSVFFLNTNFDNDNQIVFIAGHALDNSQSTLCRYRVSAGEKKWEIEEIYDCLSGIN